MKRAIISLVILLCALAGVGVASGAANYPSGGVAGTPDAQPQQQTQPVRYGTGGKISLPPPPDASWHNSGPVDTRLIPGPLGPLVPPVFGADVQVSTAGANEVTIASNPTNPLNFLAGGNNIGRFTTTDGGITWNRGTLSGGGDPAVVFDAVGNAYFAQLGNTATCPDAARVWRSTDGGLTFGAYVQAISDPSPSDHFIDKEWLAADRAAASAYLGRIYITATSFHTPPGCNLNNYIDNRMVLAYSTDQGATWSPSITMSDASHDQDQFSKPVVASNGTLYVSYQYQNCTFNCTSSIPMVNLVTKSTDGGVTFSPSITITGQTITPTGAFVNGYQYLYAGSTSSGFRHNDQAVIDIAPTNPNTIYAVWGDGRWDTSFVYQTVTGQHGDIAFSRSTDGGATWTPAVRINDDAMGNGKDQFFPWLVTGTDGTIHVSWNDRRDSGTGFQYREYYTQSTDGGLTWSANQAVADVGGTPSSFIGDYTGIAVNSDNTIVLPIWTDMRSGQQAYTDRGVLTSQGTPTPIAATATATATSPALTATTPPATSTAIATATSPASTATQPLATATTGAATATTGAATATTGAATATATHCAINFADVLPSNTFYANIRCLACRGIINGYPCGGTGEPCNGTNDPYFRPGNNLTRGQLAKIVAQSAGLNAPVSGQSFEDVLPGTAFYTYTERLFAIGAIGGYTCGIDPNEPCNPPGNKPYYRPGASVTRGQLTKIVSIAAGFTDPAPLTFTFTDVPVGSTFHIYVERLLTNRPGVMQGYPCGGVNPQSGQAEPCDSQNRAYFRVNNNLSRGQASKIVGNTFFPGCVTPSR